MSVDQLSVLDDRYVLGDLIGRGGMADVYRATDRVLRREVAVKVLRETTDVSRRGRFTAEARTLASLSHPGLITLLDAGFEADHPYLVMELVEGPTLSSVIAGSPPGPAEVARIGVALADALAYAHAAGVVHRDVKPANVLLREDGRVLLADFGIARLLDATEHHTRTDEAIGSPAYLAPEQVTGEPLTTAADVYALGLVLLESLTRVRAYGGTPVEAALARLNAAPDVPESIGVEWGSLIRSMTAREAASRPSAAQVAETLSALVLPPAEAESSGEPEEPQTQTRVLDLHPEPAAPPRRWLPPWRPERRPGRQLARRLASLPTSTVALVVGSALALALLVTMIVAAGGDGAADQPEVIIPAGVPAELEEPLRDLHEAVAGR